MTRASPPPRPAIGAALAALGLAALAISSCRDSTGPAGPRTTLRDRWYVPQVGYTETRPTVVGGLVYAATGDGWVVARDAATGAEQWRTPVGQGVRGANFVARSGVVAVGLTWTVVAFDAADGHELWRYTTPLDTVDAWPAPNPGSVVLTRLDADDETVYVPAWGASVSAVDIRTGTVRWVWEPGKSVTDTAASGVFRSGADGVRVSGDTVYASAWHDLNYGGGTSEPWLVALDRATGRELWRASFPGYTSGVTVNGAPALHGNLAILGGTGGYLWAVDRTTRRTAWKFVPAAPVQHATLTEPELYGDALYFDGGDGNAYAVRASDGRTLWKAPVDMAYADPLVTERRVYLNSGYQLWAFDRTTGRLLAKVKQPHVGDRDGFLASTPASDGAGHGFIVVNNATWSFDEP